MQMLSLSEDNWQAEIQGKNLPQQIVFILIQAISSYLNNDDSNWPSCSSEELSFISSKISFILLGDIFLELIKSNDRLLLY